WHPQQVAAVLAQQLAVLLLLPRVPAEILVRSELSRVDEDRRRDFVRPALRFVDERHMPGVKRPHGRDQSERSNPQPGTGACQFFTGTNSLHPSPRSVNLRVGGALGALWEKIKPWHSRISSSSPMKRAVQANRRR